MSDYVIKGQISDEDARLVVIDETDWSVEIDEQPIPNYDSYSGNYYVEVTNTKKLVFTKRSTGQIKAYGNVDPTEFWDEKTSDAYWYANPFVQSYLDPVWNGSAWEVTNSGTGSQTAQLMARLDTTWNEDYRPYYAKVEYTLSGGGDVESLTFLGDASGRDTVSSSSALEDSLASGSGVLMLKIWQGKDNVEYLSMRVPAGQTLTITGIYFSKLKFNDYVCDGYGYAAVAFDNATSMTGTEPDFSAALEIIGTTSRVYTSWGSYASSYKYNAATFTVSSIDPLSITVQSSTPANTPKVSIFSDRNTYLIGDNESGLNWLKSGTKTITFDWTPPSAGTYAVMVYNDSSLDWGDQCDTFTVTIAEGTATDPGTECEGYETMAAAISNVVSGTLATEQTWSVDAESYYGMYFGDGSDLGGMVNIDASASTAFTVNFMEQSYGDLVTNSTGDFYWGINYGTKNGSGSSATWSTAYNGSYHELRISAANGTDEGNWTNSYEPEKAIITFTGASTVDTMIVSGNNGSLCEVSDYTSGTEVTLTNWDGGGEGYNQIDEVLIFNESSGATITKIEFIREGAGSLEWTASYSIDSSNNGGTQEVVQEINPSGDWRIVLHNAQTACVDIDMTVTHSGSSGATWLDYTSDFYWGANDGTYNNGSWDAAPYYGGAELVLSPTSGSNAGEWADSFQPKQFRITFTGNTVNYGGIQLYDGFGGMRDNLESGVAYPLAFAHGGDYINLLRMTDYFEEFTVTAIEFSNDPYVYPCQTHSTANDACDNAIYSTSDIVSEHFITVDANSMGSILFTDLPSESGWVTFTIVNEDNSATSGFEVGGYEQNGPGSYGLIGPAETTNDETLVFSVDGGVNPLVYLVINNTGGSSCEQFSINVSFT